ncbi:MAG: homoserine dehydrogenase [Cellvibrionales bacterium]|nr:homoserine dehydrogenase [Cellvibrionales bacterium]
MSRQRIGVGLCGLGTVGSGVVTLLDRHARELSSRCGLALELVHIGARRDNPNCDTSRYKVSRDIFDVVSDPDVDILVELIGGTTTAFDLVQGALNAGKHVVTANKALMAARGNELAALAEENGVALRYEAAVAGGIPIIKTLRESLAANAIQSVAGIINGTGNFILTEMAKAGRDFEDVLAEAQALGYAEADPTFDIDGTDAAHKLVILATLAFGIPLNSEGPFTEGINSVAPEDLRFAAELGYVIKHLGIATRAGERVDLRVHPTLIPVDKQIATVDGVLNTVMIRSDGVGELVLVGPGAGALPTASAVCGDVADVAQHMARGIGDSLPVLGQPVSELQELATVPRGEVESEWYLRMVVADEPGAMADITRLLGDQDISIESLIQRPPETGSTQVSVVIVTDRAPGAAIERATSAIAALDATDGSITMLRIESFEAA